MSYVFRDEKWIQEQYYLLYSLIFVATIFGFIYFSKYVNSIMAKFLNIKQKEVDTLVNFVVEVRNEHYAKILASADLLDVMDEFQYDETEKQLLKHFLKKDRNKLTRNFEIRIVQTLKDVDWLSWQSLAVKTVQKNAQVNLKLNFGLGGIPRFSRHSLKAPLWK